MTKEEAIKYLINSKFQKDVFAMAGMYEVLYNVLNEDKNEYTEEELKELVEEAKSYV